MVLRLHGYGAWIESDGEPLEEYAVEVKDNVISCYVCSEEGKVRTRPPRTSCAIQVPPLTRCVHKNFVLHFDDDGSHHSGHATFFDYNGRTVFVKMDGLRLASYWGSSKSKIISDGARVGDIVHPYIFAPIDTTGSLAASFS